MSAEVAQSFSWGRYRWPSAGLSAVLVFVEAVLQVVDACLAGVGLSVCRLSVVRPYQTRSDAVGL